mgnify:CR=1 FL=1
MNKYRALFWKRKVEKCESQSLSWRKNTKTLKLIYVNIHWDLKNIGGDTWSLFSTGRKFYFSSSSLLHTFLEMRKLCLSILITPWFFHQVLSFFFTGHIRIEERFPGEQRLFCLCPPQMSHESQHNFDTGAVLKCLTSSSLLSQARLSIGSHRGKLFKDDISTSFHLSLYSLFLFITVK